MPERSCPYTPTITVHTGPVQIFTYLCQIIYYISTDFPVYKVFGMQKRHSRGELKCGGYGIIVFIYSDAVNIAVI